MKDKFVIILIVVASISLVSAYAEMGEKSKTPYPYVDPIIEWYDNRMAQYGILFTPEPAYYPSFYIEPLGTISCNEWTPVYGIIPESGLLIFTVTSGDFIGYANVSHMEQFYLINYFYLPCNGVEESGELNVTYMWNDNTDKEFSPNTKVKDMQYKNHFLYVKVPFIVK